MALDTILAEEQANLTLIDAWQVFADYDHNANLTSKRFTKLRYWILLMSVVATGFAVFYETVLRDQTAPLIASWSLSPSIQSLGKIVVILLPITVTVLLTWANKFARGANWIQLRGAAESVKREIFLFRAKTGTYSNQNHITKTREVRLAEQIQQINDRLMKTEVNKDGLEVYKGDLPPLYAAAEGDNGFNFLYADDYLTYRVENQMIYYKNKVEKMGNQSHQLNLRIILFGALGTFLAAVGFEVWVALTTAIVGAFTSYLEFNQYEDNVSSYNQTGRDLESLRMWWRAIPEIEKEQHSLYERFVTKCENILSSEHTSWIENMQDALEELYEETKEIQEEMLEIIEKFQNDPDVAYFVDEDPDYISAEELDALGFSMSGKSTSPTNSSTASASPSTVTAVEKSEQTKASLTQEIVEIVEETEEGSDSLFENLVDDYKEDAVDFLAKTVTNKVDDFVDDIVGEEIGDVIMGSVNDFVDEKATEIVNHVAAEATDPIDDLMAGFDNIAGNDPEPMDIRPDMLDDLFGDVNDEDNDDLSDLFGDGS